ncbi:MAG: VWA-like domain-containing protein [bacterium]
MYRKPVLTQEQIAQLPRDAQEAYLKRLVPTLRSGMTMVMPYFALLTAKLALRLAKPGQLAKDTAAGLASDGRTVWVNETFLGMDIPEQVVVLCHEVVHYILRHNERARHYQSELFNVAADLVVNSLLQRGGLRLPEGMLTPELLRRMVPGLKLTTNQVARMTAEQVYLTLQQQLPPEDAPSPQPPSSCSGNGGGASSKQDKSQDQDSDDQQDQDADDSAPNQVLSATKPGHDLSTAHRPGADDLGDDPIPGEEWGTIARQADDDLKRLFPGTDAGHILRDVLGTARPVPPWWQAVLAYVRPTAEEYSLRRPNRRHIWRNSYLPGRNPIDPFVVVAVDVSGSISNEQASDFVADIRALLEGLHVIVRLIAVDTEVRYDQVLKPGEPVPERLPGGGGTNFKPFFHMMSEESIPPEVVAFLTDGYAYYPDEAPAFPVVWVLTPEHERPPFGEITYLERAPAGAAL